MTERLLISSDDYLDGVEWGKASESQAAITQIIHGHDGVSFVRIGLEDGDYLVALNTNRLELDDAEKACLNVTEWWHPSLDPNLLYDAVLSSGE